MEELKQITGLQRPAFQVRWFQRNYGVTLPHDRNGVIITKASWEGLCAKKCGLEVSTERQLPRPQVQLVRRQKRD